MSHEFFAVAVVALLGVSLPGPDFAVVVSNTFVHGRQSGIMATLGIASAIVIHMSYCVLGLALVISRTHWLFNIIKYCGGAYLVFLGIKTLVKKISIGSVETTKNKKNMPGGYLHIWWEGFLCNLLNPKATLFFLSIFTVVVKSTTPLYIQVIFAAEIMLVSLIWFSGLSIILSHHNVIKRLHKIQVYLARVMGVVLILFGLMLTAW